MDETSTAMWAFLHFYYMDKANACIHCAPVRFSPITVQLFFVVDAQIPAEEDLTQELAEVKSHIGKYELDKGR